MTNPRFRNIGAILNKVPDQASDPGAAPEIAPDATADATVTRLEPAAPARPEVVRPTGVRTKRPATPASDESVSSSAGGGVRRVAFRLSPALRDALIARTAASQTTQGQVVLDAVEAAVDRGVLAELVDPNRSQPGAGLFPRLEARPPVEASMLVEIRLDARAVDILDGLAAQVEAKSRTHLIAVALEAYLSADRSET